MNTRLWIGGLGLCLVTALQVVTSVGLAQSSSTANVALPFIPGHHVAIEVSGHLGGCEPPDFPIPRFVGADGQTLVLGDLGRWEIDPAGCSSVGGPWSYQIGELNVPLSSGMQSGPVVLVLEQNYGLRSPVEVEATLQLPQDSTQFIYLSTVDAMNVLRTDNLELQKSLPRIRDADEVGRIVMDNDFDTPLVQYQREYMNPLIGIRHHMRQFEPEINQFVQRYHAFSQNADMLVVDDFRYVANPTQSASYMNGWVLIVFGPIWNEESLQLTFATPPGQLATAGGMVFVSMPEADHLQVIDALDPAGTVDVGAEPRALHQSRDRRQIIVSNASDGTVSLVDAATLEVTTSLPFGAAITQFTHAADSHKYFGVGDDGLLYSIDQSSAEVSVHAFSRPVVGVAGNWEERHAYVLLADHSVSELVVADAATLEVLNRRLLDFPARAIGNYVSESYYTVRPDGVEPTPVPLSRGINWLLVCCIVMVAAFYRLRKRRNLVF